MYKLFFFILLILYKFGYTDTIRIAALAYNPPFEMQTDKNGNFSGFEIALMAEICSRMQANCEFVPVSFENLFTAIDQNQFDLAMGSINIVPERENRYLFSAPVLPSAGAYMVNANSTVNLVDDLTNKKIGLQRESIYQKYLINRFNNNIFFTFVSSPNDLLLALKNGNVDAIVKDYYVAAYWTANGSDFKVLKEKIAYGYGYGFMTALNKLSLINQINNHLKNIQADGTYTKIFNTYLNF